jgi:uroporphyrinogen decarboxylase
MAFFYNYISRRLYLVNAKENAIKIIRFDHPERVVSGPPVYQLCYHGCNHEGFEGGGDGSVVGSQWSDIWGTVWHKIHDGVMGLPKGYPLADIENLKHYKFPDPNDERICKKIYQMAESFQGGDVFLGGSHRDTLWEKAYMLVGMDNMAMYFLSEPEFARDVLHKIMDFQMEIAQHYMKIGIEFASLGDDLGTQLGSLLGPKVVNEFLVPEYKRLFNFYKERNVLIGFHSCGNIESVIETFMMLGVDILNPIQATANNLDEIRARTKGRMSLQGGVSSATIMDGPVDRIVEEVKKRMKQLGQDGGYFCCPDQGMPFPKEHIDAVYKAVNDYGHYPLKD